MAATMARTSVSAGGPRNTNLPVIQHPMARMGSLVDIEVKGESTKTPSMGGLGERAKTLLAMSQEAQSFPALSERLSSRASSTRIEMYRDPDIYGTRTPLDKGKFRTSANLQPKYSTEELVFMIRERLMTGMHGLRHLFQAHDFGGEGRVSRQALQRILHSLVGYVGGDQFNRLLRQLGLDRQPTVSCEEFIACFAESDGRRSRDWMSAVQKKEIQEHPEEHLRCADMNLRGDYVTAPYCMAVLRDTFRKNTNGTGILSRLPASCAGVDGRVHSLHLYDVIHSCDLNIDDVEFAKLWSRFDPQASGAVRLHQFLKVMGLDEFGKPRPFTTPRHVLVSKDDDRVLKSVKGPSATSREEEKEAKVQQQCVEEEIKADVASEAETGEKPKSAPKMRRQTTKLMKTKAPKLEKIADCLFYRFEENYNQIIEGFKVLDFLGDGFISRIDFKLVLEEFGLKCQSTDLEHFLAKCGIRGVRGQVSYREFLAKFWNKTETGIVHRIITSKNHQFGRADHFNPDTRTDETKKVELLEGKMVEFFHKDFLTLLGALRKCDKYNIGVVTQYEFKDAVERLLGYSMSDNQWAELKDDVNLDADGLVPYPKFLERFSAPPGQWNKREVGEFLVRQVTSNTMAPAVERIKVYSAKYQAEREAVKSANEEKTRLDILKDVVEKREAGVTEDVQPSALARTSSGGEGEKERAGAEEMASMMSKMLDKPLVNQISEMKAGSPPEPFTPENQMPSILQSGPDKMVTPRGPHQAIAHDHCEKSLDELNELVCVLVRYRFHRLDKAFKAMDRKMTGRFHKGQFCEMLQQCDIFLSADELQRLWATFPVSSDGMFNFSTLVRHFTDYKRKHVPLIKERAPLEPENRHLVEQARYRQKERKLSRLRDIKVPVLGRQRTIIRERDDLLDKIKPQVLGQWDELKNIFRQADKVGAAMIPTPEMQEILNRLQINLNAEETEKLLSKFDLKNNGNFHYIEFLKFYTEKSSQDKVKQAMYSSLNHRLEKRMLASSDTWRFNPTVYDVMDRLRHKLVKEWKTIKRAFRRYDSDGKGYLKVTDFRDILRSCGIPVTDDDLYHILSEFDTQMNGKISYEDFLGTLLTHV